MKKTFLHFCFFGIALYQGNLFAQNQTETLFGENGLINTGNLGFFLAPTYGITQMDGSSATLLNLRGGLSFKDKFTAGAYFNTAHNESRPRSEADPNIYMDYWTVGGFAEYTLYSKKIVHVTFPFYIGYGEVEMNNATGNTELGKANFFQIEPSALLEVNLNEYIRFNIGAGYRFVGQMNYRNLNQSDISGLTTYVGLKFGIFR